jgi:hypothetical protein
LEPAVNTLSAAAGKSEEELRELGCSEEEIQEVLGEDYVGLEGPDGEGEGA